MIKCLKYYLILKNMGYQESARDFYSWEWEKAGTLEAIKKEIDNLLFKFLKERNETNIAWPQKEAFLVAFNNLRIEDQKKYLDFVSDNYFKWNCEDAEEFKELIDWMTKLNMMEVYATMRNACNNTQTFQQSPQNNPSVQWWKPDSSSWNFERNDWLPNTINLQLLEWSIYHKWSWKDYYYLLKSTELGRNISINKWEDKWITLNFDNKMWEELNITYDDISWYIIFNNGRNTERYYIDMNDDDRTKEIRIWELTQEWKWRMLRLKIKLNLDRNRTNQRIEHTIRQQPQRRYDWRPRY